MTDHTVPPIGMRMVKTAAAVLICLLVSMAVDREDMRIYSSIAALLCVQPYAEDTKRMAIQRIVGTAIGSVFGIATLLLEMDLDIQGTLVGYIVIAAVTVPNLWIAVVLKSPTGQQRFEDAKALLNYGFSTYALLHTVPEEPFPAIPVVLGETETVQPCIDPQEAVALVQKSQAGGLSQSVTLAEQVEAPVSAGQELGTLTLTDAAGETVQSIPIRAAQSVERLTFGTMLRRMLSAAFFAG